jgi:putative ABC transport system permease protein
MKLFDAASMGLYNLRKSKLRTILTILGVVIGIGTLSSMISFGVGMENNVLNSFKNNDLFNGLILTEKKFDVESAMNGETESSEDDNKVQSPPLNDSTLKIIRNIKNVEIAYPEIFIPAKIIFGNNDIKTSVKALPSELNKYPPFNNISFGRFVKKEKINEIVLSDRILKRLKIIVKDFENTKLSDDERKKGFSLLVPDSILGKNIIVITASVNDNLLFEIASKAIFSGMNNDSARNLKMFKDNEIEFRIVGINMTDKKMIGGSFTENAIISLESAKLLPSTDFSSVWDLIGRNDSSQKGKYNSVYVRVKSPKYVGTVKKQLKKMNYQIFSFIDQLDEIRNNFIIVDMMLSAIGIIALFVAGLGIINTMVMSILERKKEIGIMKALGAAESDIKKIFFVEASIIGLFGGILGLLLGWSVTEIATIVIKANIPSGELVNAQLFSFPFWLLGGAILFSIIISLTAALYPAYRAASVDPVIALRNE